MNQLRLIFEICVSILSIPINLFGYQITLFSVLAFSISGSFILYILFKILR